MKFVNGVTGILLSALLSLPMVAMADKDKHQRDGYEDCSGQKGKSKCRSEEQGKGKNKDKHKHKSDYESEREHSGHGGHGAGGPPPWAPAHGWRGKQGEDAYEGGHEEVAVIEHGGTHVMVSNGAATVDVGIEQGTCNRDAIGAVVGGIIGGAIGNKAGDKNNREISTVLGVVIGGVVGHEIGKSMDKADQSCTGQVLEQAADNKTVQWAADNGSGEYSVTPLRTYQENGLDCRDYITEYQGAKGSDSERSTACRNTEGAWSKMRM
ncbi:MAG: RT0821/Lpp0805 family surface protein [Chromatiales bacterium]|nr:RT0821/Lpp0805 family surface protein [Chromatiales bacterium]